MSAREWYHCPFCKSDMKKAKEEYGKIPIDKFVEKYKEAMSTDWNGESYSPEELETVRMDGEEWLDDDGDYHIEHELSCNKCGREWSFKLKIKPLDGDENFSNKLIFQVPSKSGGDNHEVEFDKQFDKYKCDCVGFRTRKKCSHIDYIKNKMETKQKQ